MSNNPRFVRLPVDFFDDEKIRELEASPYARDVRYCIKLYCFFYSRVRNLEDTHLDTNLVDLKYLLGVRADSLDSFLKRVSDYWSIVHKQCSTKGLKRLQPITLTCRKPLNNSRYRSPRVIDREYIDKEVKKISFQPAYHRDGAEYRGATQEIPKPEKTPPAESPPMSTKPDDTGKPFRNEKKEEAPSHIIDRPSTNEDYTFHLSGVIDALEETDRIEAERKAAENIRLEKEWGF